MDYAGDNKIQVRIITPESVVLEVKADEVSVPTASGEISVLPHHASMVTLAVPGILTVKHDGVEEYFAIANGVVQISPDNTLTILVTHSEHSDSIDLERAEEAYQRAQKAMEEKSTLSDVDFANFQSSLEKNLARIKTARRRRM